MSEEQAEKGTEENPLTREDVLEAIEENDGKAKGLDLSGKWFEEDINLFGLDLSGIILKGAVFPASQRLQILTGEMKTTIPHKKFAPLIGTSLAGVKLQEADLSSARLNGINMTAAQLQKANLSFTQFAGTNLMLAQLQGANLEYADLNNAYMWGADLRNADISNTQLGGTGLGSANMEGASLHGANFSTDTDLSDIYWGNYILGEERDGLFKPAADVYRHLKKWYTDAGMYDIAGNFYYREKYAATKNLKWRSHFWYRLALGTSNILFGYGEQWWKILGWMALVVFGSAVAYLFGGLNLLYSLYFSVVSFTALGYGSWVNITPPGWVQALGAAESVIGVFMMALLLVTFVRKWAR